MTDRNRNQNQPNREDQQSSLDEQKTGMGSNERRGSNRAPESVAHDTGMGADRDRRDLDGNPDETKDRSQMRDDRGLDDSGGNVSESDPTRSDR